MRGSISFALVAGSIAIGKMVVRQRHTNGEESVKGVDEMVGEAHVEQGNDHRRR